MSDDSADDVHITANTQLPAQVTHHHGNHEVHISNIDMKEEIGENTPHSTHEERENNSESDANHQDNHDPDGKEIHENVGSKDEGEMESEAKKVRVNLFHFKTIHATTYLFISPLYQA